MICKEHRKRIASDDDMRAYSSRPYCTSNGDCRCPVCSTVCWVCRPLDLGLPDDWYDNTPDRGPQ